MKKLLAITILLISNLCFSQLKAVIIDNESKEKLPYVNIWIENENIGTTSNENGEFELKVNGSKIIVFSAIGFETKKINSNSIKNIIELEPLVTELKEVIIKSEKLTEKIIIDKFKKSKINHYFACGTTPWIAAKYFEYKQDYDKIPFLNKIRVLTDSDVKDSKFNIRLYSINKNGEPENYIYDENIIGIAQKGNTITEIDLSDLNITFPKEGFFIAIEWLIIESNKYEYNYTKQGSKNKLIGISYEPAIGIVPSETDRNSWSFNQGKWKKELKDKGSSKNYKDKFRYLAIELTLTN